MSDGRKLPWAEAYEIARQISERLSPLVARCKCVGSVRRRRPEVSDIEFLVEPFMEPGDLFGTPLPELGELTREVFGMGDFVKGGKKYIQVMNVLDHLGVSLDVFICTPPAEWGGLLAIRTGPAELGMAAMMALKGRGLQHKEGHIEGVPTPTEEAFFEAAGLECRPPHERDAYAEELGVQRI